MHIAIGYRWFPTATGHYRQVLSDPANCWPRFPRGLRVFALLGWWHLLFFWAHR
jgi:hypothetical protein